MYKSKGRQPNKFNMFKKNTRKMLCEKYKTDTDTYNKKIINEIIYNDKSKMVAAFKDYLIYDDLSEFMRR